MERTALAGRSEIRVPVVRVMSKRSRRTFTQTMNCYVLADDARTLAGSEQGVRSISSHIFLKMTGYFKWGKICLMKWQGRVKEIVMA